MTIKQRKIDNTKAGERLGFQPKTSFEAGLAKTIAWYKSTCEKRNKHA